MKGSYFGFFHGVLTELWISPRSFDSPSDLLRREFAIRSGRVRRRGSQIVSGQYFGVGIETIRVAVLVKEALASCCGVNLAGAGRGGASRALASCCGWSSAPGAGGLGFLHPSPDRFEDFSEEILRLPWGSAARCSGSLRNPSTSFGIGCALLRVAQDFACRLSPSSRRRCDLAKRRGFMKPVRAQQPAGEKTDARGCGHFIAGQGYNGRRNPPSPENQLAEGRPGGACIPLQAGRPG